MIPFLTNSAIKHGILQGFATCGFQVAIQIIFKPELRPRDKHIFIVQMLTSMFPETKTEQAKLAKTGIDTVVYQPMGDVMVAMNMSLIQSEVFVFK